MTTKWKILLEGDKNKKDLENWALQQLIMKSRRKKELLVDLFDNRAVIFRN